PEWLRSALDARQQLALRVALYTDSPRPGGAELYFITLANGLARTGIETHAISPVGPATAYFRERLDAAVNICDVGSRVSFDSSFARNVVLALRPLVQLRHALRSIRPDILHICNGGYPGSHTCRAAVLATRVPRVMTINSQAQPRIGGRGLA